MTGATAGISEAQQVVKALLTDAELVANVAVRLGRLKNLQLLSDIGALKRATESGADCSEAIGALQTSLNVAIKEIEPITLRDLRSGWSPFTAQSKNLAIIVFGVFAIVLICLTAYATSLYNRVAFAHASLVEIQTARVSEQVMRFYDLLRYNQSGMIQAFKGGSTRDVIIESFYKSYFDLKTTDEKLAVMVRESFDLTADAAILSRLTRTFGAVSAWLGVPGAKAAETEKNLQQVRQWQQNYGGQPYGGIQSATAGTPAGTPVAAPPGGGQAASGQPGSGQANNSQANNGQGGESVDALVKELRLFFFNAAAFISEVSLFSMNPVSPIPIYETILRLHEAMYALGLWYLPALYGMLGSTVFHMRRFLDPNIANPSSIRTAYRIFLGAFAGIVVVWFWSPSPKSGEPVVSALSTFSVAFLVGFSIDIFFQALDRLVTKVGQAIGGQ